MNVEVSRLKLGELFASIRWNAGKKLWESASYRHRVERNIDCLDGPERIIQLASIEAGDLFKAAIIDVSFSVDASLPSRPVNMRLSFLDRNLSKRIEISYRDVKSLTASGLGNMLIDAEVLGFELVREGGLIRHAILFIEEEYAIIRSRSVTMSIAFL